MTDGGIRQEGERGRRLKGGCLQSRRVWRNIDSGNPDGTERLATTLCTTMHQFPVGR